MRQYGALNLGAALFSILLSCWAAAKTTVINPDAICYLYAASAMEHGLSFASHLCSQAKWPFYSILIFGLTQLTHLSYTTAAYILDGFFSLISVMTFIAIINLFTQKTRILMLAAIVILLAHEFNNLRVEIIRDHGYWAFYLLSLFFILQSVKKIFQQNNHSFYYAILWSVSLAIATLFRIEGLIFLLFLPFAAFLFVQQAFGARIKMFFQLNILTLLGGSALLVWTIMYPQQQYGRLLEVEFQLTQGLNLFTQTFQQTMHALATHVLSVYSARDAVWILMGMLAFWYILNIISNVSLIYAALIIYAWCKKVTGFNRETRVIVWAYIFINVLITAVFLVDNLFLAKRYLIALSLVLMLWVPFALDDLIMQWRTRKWPVLVAAIFILIYGLGGIFDFGHSKKYIRDGGDWLALHAAPNAKIYSNNYQLLYYSKHFGEDIFSLGKKFQNLNVIANNKWRKYDYVALNISQKELTQKPSILQEIKIVPTVVFQNDRGDQVLIYEIREEKR
ncbi:MAG TPA: hypothetical protein VLI69_08645 [Gammaproteobacteria bacterium]|nr:hypothetical protein [Gammaproteobacteria bacterium]